MAYNDTEREFEQTNHLYEDNMYNDTFGERLDGDAAFDPNMDEDRLSEDKRMADDADKLEDGFGETISSQANPHIDDQLSDDNLNREAEAKVDYSSDTPANNKDESLIDKAKSKIEEITHKDK